jgi:ParB family transcriptional regulator, chromosome partitioning protein
VRTVPVERLRPNRHQPRTHFDESRLEELTESIRAQGVIQPLLVRPNTDGSYTIVAGERRWRAAQRAGLAAVPVVVREMSDDGQLLELALVENLQRDDLNAVEEADAYRELQEKFALSQEEIGRRVGKSRATVANTLRLLQLPAAVLDLLRGGHLTAGQARPLLAIEDPKQQQALADRAVAEGWTARQLEDLAARRQVAGARSAGRRRPPVAPEPHATAAAERLTQRLQAKVEIRRRGRGGTLRIHFHTEEELMRLFDLLMERRSRP